MKGGVGKTTLTVHLALGLAKFHDKRVLLVDMDPQSNATQYLMKPEEYVSFVNNKLKCTSLDIFIDRETESVGTGSARTQKTTEVIPNKDNSTVRIYGNDSSGHLDLIPSRLELMEADVVARGIENRLKIFLDKIKPAYDVILIDCPPTVGLFTLSSYIVSDAYLVPVKPDYLSSVGISLIEKAFKRYAKNFPNDIKFLGTVFQMVQPTNLMDKTMETMKGNAQWKCFDNHLSHSTRIAETVENNKSIFDLTADSGRYANEMTKIVDEFSRRIASA